jgi:hypothetical protein
LFPSGVLSPTPRRSHPSTEWSNSRPERGAEGVGLPSRLEPLHLAARREGPAPLLTPEEPRALLLDRRGPGCAWQVEGCWWIKLVSTYDPQAYGPTPFSPRDSQGSCQSAEQGDY